MKKYSKNLSNEIMWLAKLMNQMIEKNEKFRVKVLNR
jgi:hypothetical protein